MVLGVALLAALLIFVSEFMPVATVNVAQDDCQVIADRAQRDRCTLSGFERHGGSFLLIGLFVGAMGWGAAAGRSRPAAVAMIAVGAVVVVVALALDWPEAGRTGAIGGRFESASGARGPGLYVELVGGLMAMLAGVMALGRPREGPD